MLVLISHGIYFYFRPSDVIDQCLDSSAGQSDSLVSCRSRVQIPPEAPPPILKYSVDINTCREIRQILRYAGIHAVLT
jgi:hypothetical protein